MAEALREISSFLENYTLQDYTEPNPNFFKIAGFPRWENVSSNILQYFFRNQAVLNLFLECTDDNDLKSSPITGEIEVLREEQTENLKRIDLVIITNKFVIGIENKIGASLYNPVDDYNSHLKKEAGESKIPKLIILSETPVIKDNRYARVTHGALIKKIQKNYYKLLNVLGHRDFLLLTEYINNIESLQGARYMNEKFIKFAAEDDNADKIEQIAQKFLSVNLELKNIAYKILEDLGDEIKPFTNKDVWQARTSCKMLATAYLDSCFFEGNKYNCAIDIDVTVKGYKLLIFDRGNKTLDAEFINILKKRLPTFTSDFKQEIKDKTPRFVYKNDFSFDEYDELLKLVKEILTSFAKETV